MRANTYTCEYMQLGVGWDVRVTARVGGWVCVGVCVWGGGLGWCAGVTWGGGHSQGWVRLCVMGWGVQLGLHFVTLTREKVTET